MQPGEDDAAPRRPFTFVAADGGGDAALDRRAVTAVRDGLPAGSTARVLLSMVLCVRCMDLSRTVVIFGDRERAETDAYNARCRERGAPTYDYVFLADPDGGPAAAHVLINRGNDAFIRERLDAACAADLLIVGRRIRSRDKPTERWLFSKRGEGGGGAGGGGFARRQYFYKHVNPMLRAAFGGRRVTYKDVFDAVWRV